MKDFRYRLDRTAHHAGTHQEAEVYHARSQPETLEERLRAAMYLNAIAYGYDPEHPPRMDKTVFSMGRLDERQDGSNF